MTHTWILYDQGKAGTRIQCEGLVQLLGLSDPNNASVISSLIQHPVLPKGDQDLKSSAGFVSQSSEKQTNILHRHSNKPEITSLTSPSSQLSSSFCSALASASGMNHIQAFEISARWPWRWLPPHLWPFALSGIKPKLTPPWPDLIIAAGRATVAPCMALKRQLGDAICIIQLMNPRVSCKNFDWVIAPQHDQVSGPNVIQTLGTLHTLTHEKLTRAAADLMSHIAHLPRPYHVVLLGGPTRRHHFDSATLDHLLKDIRQAAQTTGGSILLSSSRRTPLAYTNILEKKLQGIPHFISPQYYQGFLGVADTILVTSDSVSMLTEACFTGQPVYIYGLSGDAGKFNRFYQALVEKEHARFFRGTFEPFLAVPLDERESVKKALV